MAYFIFGKEKTWEDDRAVTDDDIIRVILLNNNIAQFHESEQPGTQIVDLEVLEP